MSSYSADEYERACQILGVPADATPGEINDAYKEKILRAHPDAGGDEEATKDLNWARDVVNDAEARVAYEEAQREPPMLVFEPSVIDFGEVASGNPTRCVTTQLRNDGGPLPDDPNPGYDMPEQGSFWLLSDAVGYDDPDTRVIFECSFEASADSELAPGSYTDTVRCYYQSWYAELRLRAKVLAEPTTLHDDSGHVSARYTAPHWSSPDPSPLPPIYSGSSAARPSYATTTGPSTPPVFLASSGAASRIGHRFLWALITVLVIGGFAAGIAAIVIHDHAVSARQAAEQQAVCADIFTPQDFVGVIHQQPESVSADYGQCSYNEGSAAQTEIDLSCGAAAQSKWRDFQSGSTNFDSAVSGARLQYHRLDYAWQDWIAAITPRGKYLEVSLYDGDLSTKQLESKTADILRVAFNAESHKNLCPSS